MSAIVEDISSTKKRLKIEISADVIDREYQTSLNKVRQSAKIPGFRPGHAPIPLIERKFGNDIKSDIIDRLVPQYYTKAMKEAALVPVTMPNFESAVELKKSEPLSFSLTVEVRPSITGLKYEGLKVDDPEVSVEEREIEETLDGLREERAVYEAVDREAGDQDLLVIDFEKLDPSGEGETSSGTDRILNLGGKVTPPAVVEALVGKRKGDVAELSVPAFDESGAETGDKETPVRVTIKEIKEKKLPGVDDEFAKDFGHASLDELKAHVRERLLAAKKGSVAREQKRKLLDAILDSHDFDVPESLLESELEHLSVNEQLSAKQAGDLGAEVEKPQANALSGEERADRLRPKAMRNVKASILLEMIAEKEEVTVSEEEMRERILLLSRSLKATPEAVMNLFITRDGSLENLRNSLREEKVMDVVLSKAEVVKGA